MIAQLTPNEELERQRAIAIINIIEDANALKVRIARLEYIQLEMSEFITGQQNLIHELYAEIALQQAIDSTCAAMNIQLYNENVDFEKKVIKQKSTIKILTWTTIGLGAITALFIIAN